MEPCIKHYRYVSDCTISEGFFNTGYFVYMPLSCVKSICHRPLFLKYELAALERCYWFEGLFKCSRIVPRWSRRIVNRLNYYKTCWGFDFFFQYKAVIVVHISYQVSESLCIWGTPIWSIAPTLRCGISLRICTGIDFGPLKIWRYFRELWNVPVYKRYDVRKWHLQNYRDTYQLKSFCAILLVIIFYI